MKKTTPQCQYPGIYIAIEGGDGSGKATQTKLLADTLKNEGHDVMSISYPQYGEMSARYVERYLNGVYGEANDVPPDLAALTYAIDRANHESLRRIREHLEKPRAIVVSDRSPASNMAHQGTKIESAEKRQEFYQEILELEYTVLAEPKPDLNIVLRAPSKLAQQNVDKKATRGYTSKKRDIHEADARHLDLALRGYEELCQQFPDEFIAIPTLDAQGALRSIPDVHAEIIELVKSRYFQ